MSNANAIEMKKVLNLLARHTAMDGPCCAQDEFLEEGEGVGITEAEKTLLDRKTPPGSEVRL